MEHESGTVRSGSMKEMSFMSIPAILNSAVKNAYHLKTRSQVPSYYPSDGNEVITQRISKNSNSKSLAEEEDMFAFD